ncbi:MAG TPA: 2-isopropylmalate synthase, partial [Chromatiaceae bacterium]|nr:2-isopropylmalate synthase [Chromatiaceae bacterium]
EVRIPKGGRTDALTECIITWAGEAGPVRTRGVHTNQVFAAIAATLRLVNILVHRAGHGVAALPVLETGA